MNAPVVSRFDLKLAETQFEAICVELRIATTGVWLTIQLLN